MVHPSDQAEEAALNDANPRVPVFLLVVVGAAAGMLVITGLTGISIAISRAEGNVGLVPPWLILVFSAFFGLLVGTAAGLLGAAGYAMVRRVHNASTLARAFAVGMPSIAIGVALFALLTAMGPQNYYGVFVAAVPGLALFVAVIVRDRRLSRG